LPPLAIFIAVVAALTALGLFELTSAQFSRAVLFMCNMRPLGNCGWALGHTWSLAYEEQFYLLFPLLVASLGLIDKRHRLLSILAGLVAVFLLATLSDEASFLGFYVNNFIYLVAGCACALYWDELQPILKNIPFAAWIVITLSLVGLNAIALPATIRTFVYPVVFPVLVCIAVFGTPIHRPLVQAIFLNPLLAHLGRISYGIYLWQQLATYDYGFSSPVTALILVAISIVFAHYSFKHVELPLIELGAKKLAIQPVPISPVSSDKMTDDLEEELQQTVG
jgi:peptidoglycan/LPS O-acetylase OafA/YrhL